MTGADDDLDDFDPGECGMTGADDDLDDFDPPPESAEGTDDAAKAETYYATSTHSSTNS